jgi:hypothetical protein
VLDSCACALVDAVASGLSRVNKDYRSKQTALLSRCPAFVASPRSRIFRLTITQYLVRLRVK